MPAEPTQPLEAEEEAPTGAPPAAEPAPAPEGAAAGPAEDGAPSEPAAPEPPVDPEDPALTLAAERDRYLALAQRTQADFDNFRKRTAREVGLAEARGMGKLARELLSALDTLEQALAHGVPEGSFGEGIRLVQNELRAALARVGIEAYAPKGEPFDPQVHEAVSQLPAEGVASGTVFEVVQTGYRHGDTVLRPARVVVAA